MLPPENRNDIENCEIRFRSLYENSFDAVLLTKPDGSILSANPAACELFGLTEKELQNAKRNEIMVEDERFRTVQREREMTNKGRVELTLKRKDGSTFEAEVTSSVFTDLDGIVKTSMIIRDVTERKRADETLRASEEKYKSLFEQAADYILVLELPKAGVPIIRDANEAALKMHGYTREEFVNKSISLIDKRIDEAQTKWIADNVADGKVLVFEVVHYRKDGTCFNAEVAVKAVKLGSETWILSVERDITERKKTEEALKASEAKMRLLTDNMRDVVWIMNLDGRFTYVSPSVYQLRGYTAEEVQKQTLEEVMTPNSKKIVIDNLKKLRKFNGTPTKYLEIEQTRKDGSTVWTEVNVNVVRDEQGKPQQIIGVSRDITERKKTEEKLRQSDLFFENSLDMVCIGGFDGYLKVTNPAWSKTLGWSTKELLSKPWIEFVHPNDRKETIHLNKTLLKGTTVIQLENRYLCKNGTFKWLCWNAIPYQKDQIVFGFARDITGKKEAEGRLEAANEKLRVTGSLTRHDVRNKLSIIKSTVYLIKKRANDNPELQVFLQDIDNAVDASNKLFEFSSVYEKIGLEKRTKIDISEYFWQAADLLHNLTIKIVEKCNGLVVTADTLIRQLFYNLLDNSCKHGQTVTEVKLYYTEKADCIELIYQDNGIGIPQENKTRIFTEGFTTSNGSGLGLMLVKKMVEAYGWTITENGEEGKGAKFVITIPKTKL